MPDKQAVLLDKEINPSRVQAINNADALAGFFADLGWNTGARITQTAGNLGITADSIAKQIKRIERLANQDDLLQVYLFEVSSVTVALTQGLARAFRTRAGNYLLVLTNDYERLDFVLLDRLPSTRESETIGQQQAGIRPRSLSVDRRNPERRHLRVLRRFTYTESDPIYQHEKLRAAYEVAYWSEDFFDNRALFSDYYLLNRLPDEPAWKDDPHSAYRRLCDLYINARTRWAAKTEGELRKDLFLPLFDILGFKTVEKKSPKSEAGEPDYHLHAADGKTHLADCNVYTWERSLDGPDDVRDKETSNENPAALAVSLLERGDAKWAIVTNGRCFRLYSARAHNRATNYYEIDLEDVISRQDPNESFRYFWLIFRREAFEVEPVEVAQDQPAARTVCFLDRLFEGSQDYAKKLGERLKERVFEQIFPHFAEGFIEHLHQTKKIDRADITQDQLDKVYQGTLTFLYRLLFLLYAESRDLLPVKEYHGFFQTSLTRLKREAADALGSQEHEMPPLLKKAFREDSYALYDRLMSVFRVVDKGDSSVNVPIYNGGLFLTEVSDDDTPPEAENARFLLAHKVPDRFLALGLDLLARDEDEKTFKLVPIDYKSLGVRQLGSIYEGLLEFKLHIARERLAILRVKNRDVFVPSRELDDDQRARWEKAVSREENNSGLFGLIASDTVVKKNQAYLENDKRERKATGSYYTPDHIVDYIVEHTVGPVLDEKLEAMRPKLREAEKERQEFFKRQEAFRKEGMKPEPDSKADLAGKELVQLFFDIKVLDPAMGSGHFLVEAVDFITDRMLDFLNSFPWNPVRVHLANMRRTILDEMEKQGVIIDEGRLTDVNLLKRHILKRCIYGVDINPMAVELAKVSLWLDCFTLGAPLSFLDHHLRCGNSLIGVSVSEAKRVLEVDEVERGTIRVARGGKWDKKRYETRALTMLFGSRFAGLLLATDLMRHVGALSDITSSQVHQSRDEYRKASTALLLFKRVLDGYTAQWFREEATNPVGRRKKDKDADTQLLEFLKSRDAEPFLNAKTPETLAAALKGLPKDDRVIAEDVLKAAEGNHFFHWELEFPEVFYGPQSGTTQKIVRLPDAGFDAVVGNPPYVNANELNRILSPCVKPFWQQAFASASGTYDVYVLFFEQALRLLDGHGRAGLITPNKYLSAPYAEALRTMLYDEAFLIRLMDVSRVPVFEDPSVYPVVTIYCRGGKNRPAQLIIDQPEDGFDSINSMRHEYSSLALLPSHIWGCLLSTGISLLTKIVSGSQRLESICEVNASSTAAEADDYSAAIAENPKRTGRGWPIVNTGTIAPFRFQWGEKPLTDKGNHYMHPWLPDKPLVSENRRKQYGSPKIIFAKVAKRIEAAFDSTGTIASLNTNFAFVEGTAGYYYLGVVNCALMTWVYEQYFGALRMGGGYLQFQAPQLRLLPVKEYDPRHAEMGRIATLSKKASGTTGDSQEIEREIDRIVCGLYGLTEAEVAIVEGRK